MVLYLRKRNVEFYRFVEGSTYPQEFVPYGYKGIKGASEIKNRVYQTTSIRDIIQLLNEFEEGYYVEW